MCVRRTLITGALILTFPCVFSVCVVLTGKMREETSSFHSKATTTASSLENTMAEKQHATDDVTLLRHFMDCFSGSVQSEKIVHFVCKLNWKTSRCVS